MTYNFSILIGLVSTEDDNRILEALECLRKQEGNCTYEVIIADRRGDQVSQRISTDYPEVCLITCAPDTSLPELRTTALDRASGEYIIVTEDHCVPASDWLKSIAKAFREAPGRTAAVGGCVENGVCDRALDWATFLCEYSFFTEPVTEGLTSVLPGMNVAYRREIFSALDRDLLISGFWETTVHPILLEQDWKLFSSNHIRIFHCKKFSLGLFSSQRFIYSRYYAGLRFKRRQVAHRSIAAMASLILPGLLLARMARQISAKKRFYREFLWALPNLTLFVVIWAAGEMVGYIFGPGDALVRIE